MDPTTDQIESHIDFAREELKSNLEELESRVKSVADWRTHFARHPLSMIAVAVVGGALLSIAIAKRG